MDNQSYSFLPKQVMKCIYEKRKSLDHNILYNARIEKVEHGNYVEIWFMTKGCQWDAKGGCTICNYGKNLLLQMKEQVKEIEKRTKYIVIAHSIPFLTPKNVDFWELCKSKEPLFESVPYFSLSGQPCAIYHMGVQAAEGLASGLDKDGDGVLLIGADKVYCADDRIFFHTIMGDSVLAAFITKNTVHNTILMSYSESYVVGYAGEYTPEEVTKEFRRTNFINIRNAMEICAAKAGLTMNDVTYIVPHSCNLQMWDNVSTIARFPREKILDCYLSRTGHLNSNDSFIHYQRAVRDGIIKEGDICMLVNPGFGGTRGCTLLQY